MSAIDVPGMRLRHIAALDGVRACSIMLVVAGHWLPLGPKALQLNGAAAAMGMSLFFILSGFLITRGLEANSNIGEFLIKRMFRIAPVAFMYFSLVYVFYARDIGALLREMTFTLNYHPESINLFNPHIWSLCVEVQFYAIIGIIFSQLRKPAPFLILLLCGIVTGLKIIAHDAYSMQLQLRGDELFAGSLLYMSMNGSFGDHSMFWRKIEAFSPVLLIVLLLTCHPATGILEYFRAYAAALLVGSVLFSRRAWLSRMLASRPMVYLAKTSYAIYVIHVGAAAGVAAALGTGSKVELYLVQRPIAGAVTWAAAHFSSFYYERPWNDLGRFLALKLRGGSAKPLIGSPRSTPV